MVFDDIVEALNILQCWSIDDTDTYWLNVLKQWATFWIVLHPWKEPCLLIIHDKMKMKCLIKRHKLRSRTLIPFNSAKVLTTCLGLPVTHIPSLGLNVATYLRK